jgi:hypothetical protein
VQPVEDPTVAQWITDSIHGFAQDVGSMIPEGFDAYLRVLHPAGKREGSEWLPVTWREIATANGKEFHPEMQFEFLVPDGCFDDARNQRHAQEGLWDSGPDIGELPEEVAVALVEILQRCTGTPEHCYFAYWEGWGDPIELMATRIGERLPAPEPSADDFAGTPRAGRDRAAKFSIPGRAYYLFEGPLTDVATGWTGPMSAFPSLWWPADRSWCVATEIDFDTTFVAGPTGISDAILGHPRLEAIPALPSHRIGHKADRINGP